MVNGMRGECNNLPTSSGVKRGRYKSYTTGTYVKLIACVIQDSPNRMLTFKQIMKKLEPFVFGDQKSIENNIRVCLSSNGCFTKVPVDPQYPNPKKNYWKVDERGITPKMLRRHFNYIIDTLPGLSHQTHQQDTCGNAVVHQPLLPCNVPSNKSEVKFTGPFSIDSILKRDHKVTHSTLQYQDAQRKTTNRENISHYNTTDFYSYNSLGRELDTVERSRLFTEPQCGLPVSPRIPLERRAFPSNWCSPPLMYASTRYSVW